MDLAETGTATEYCYGFGQGLINWVGKKFAFAL